jgi:peptide/nickel transport system substrate-binding protein
MMKLIIVIGILAALVLTLNADPFFAYAQENITITVDKESFSAGETVVITGTLENAEEGTPVAIEVRDADGQTLVVRTVSTDADGNYRLEFKVPSSAKAGDLTIFTNAEVDGEKASSSKTVTVEATSSTDNQPSGSNSQCIIATAAFGSELEPQVQFLRNFRDNHILGTASGTSFMAVFNSWYYSFSPAVADFEREQPLMQQTVKTAIYPLLGILQASEKAYLILPGEYGSISAGLIVSSLIGAVYASPIALSIKRIRNFKLSYRLAGAVIAIVATSVVVSLNIGNEVALMVTTSLLVVSTLSIAAILSANTISRLIKKGQ